MPQTDRSTAILTGMIIAALYVILLVGFSQESYMRRDFEMRRSFAARAESAASPAIEDVSKRVCGVETPFCTALFSVARARQNCVASIDAVRAYLNAQPMPLTLEGVRRAMKEP